MSHGCPRRYVYVRAEVWSADDIRFVHAVVTVPVVEDRTNSVSGVPEQHRNDADFEHEAYDLGYKAVHTTPIDVPYNDYVVRIA